MSVYSEKLRSPKWQRRRLEILQRANWRCESCEDGSSEIHVHHRHYVRGREPWEYANHELVALCGTCHTDEHAAIERLWNVITYAHPQLISWDRLTAFVAGFLYAQSCCRTADDEAQLVEDAAALGQPVAFAVGKSAFSWVADASDVTDLEHKEHEAPFA